VSCPPRPRINHGGVDINFEGEKSIQFQELGQHIVSSPRAKQKDKFASGFTPRRRDGDSSSSSFLPFLSWGRVAVLADGWESDIAT
jgi:hypothetical protein